ncbi:MAG: HAMP domain-containing sensor histidine kinase [Myxococcota bacterium]
MRRLYLQIYLGFLAIGVALCIVMGAAWGWHMATGHREVPTPLAAMAELIAERLPGPGGDREELAAALNDQSQRLTLDMTVWGPDGERLASSGLPLPKPELDGGATAWIRRRQGPPGLAVRLADRRWLGLALTHRPHSRAGGWLVPLLLLAGVTALGSYPIARRIAGRLERLGGAVEQLGAGDLSTRVPVEGRDEVSDLARSFNRAADRIERLVNAQRRLLASASHELRSPLARLRLAVELMGAGGRPELQAEAVADVDELDALIEDLLLASRLQTLDRPGSHAPVELVPLLAEEAARVGAEVVGDPATVPGDARLLRRMARNLLENAHRHGAGSIEVRVAPVPDGDGFRITVADRGPGVPEEERERIFEPFYRPQGHAEGQDGGVGLGLALVREIARYHGGEARCVPRPGGGTLFEVDLPGSAPEATQSLA